ncbi:MAG: hypothetical protein GY862_36225 [Gammaproteobacteria bacterium]|nr:hypothetical protein [Gammaproteobacteria bacterium]
MTNNKWFGFFLLLLSVPGYGYGDIGVDIVHDNGERYPQHFIAAGSGGAYRAYIEAIRGNRYGIRIQNNTEVRIGLVISVDGRNIISGKKSYLSPDERMYILDAYETATYSGWRSGQDRVNRFYFTDARNSYAYAWEDTAEIGVIALAVYHEQRRHYRDRKYKQSPSPGLRSEAGTGFGEDAHSPSIRVRFIPERSANSEYILRYEWRETLCRKTLIRCQQHNQWQRHPNDGFAQPPPKRRTVPKRRYKNAPSPPKRRHRIVPRK